MISLPLLTASRLKDARACARLDSIKYVLGYRPVASDSEALALGTLVHAGLEAWWKHLDGEPLAVAIEAIRAAQAEPYAKARAEAMLAGYHVKWLDVSRGYEVVAVEQEFRAPLINPATGAASRTYQLAGKIDAVVRERDTDRVLLVEHKTSSEDIGSGSFYWRRLRMDGQVSLYFAGARALGYDPAGCLYDIIAKPRQRPYQANSKRAQPESADEFRDRLCDAIAATPDAYYMRGEVARDSADLADAAADRWMIAESLRDNLARGRHPRNPDACARYGRTCD